MEQLASQLSLEVSIFSLLLPVGAIDSTAAGAEGRRGDKVLSGTDVRLCLVFYPTGALSRTPLADLLDCLASSPPSGLTVSRLLYDACQCPRRRQLRQVSMLGHAGDRQ